MLLVIAELLRFVHHEEKKKMATTTRNDWRDTLLDWTAKQGRILTDEGRANDYYCSERGFPFASNELPHYYLEKGNSHEIFHRWAEAAATNTNTPSSADKEQVKSPIVGVWSRPLFVGKWEYSTDKDEIVYNVQTASLFIDLRIPTGKPSHWENLLHNEKQITSSCQFFEAMSDEDLRLYARQHVFAGYSIISREGNKNNKMSNNLPLCTRHHCIDWNYVVGKPRPRPNKWYIEGESTRNETFQTWNEWSFSTDNNGQSYYKETWERIAGDDFGRGFRLAMRRKEKVGNRDAILVAVGDHFNFIVGRQSSTDLHKRYANARNTVELVDSAIRNGDRDTAMSYLSLAGGHGTISSGWRVDCAIQPWQHGKRVFNCLQNDTDTRNGNEKAKVIGRGDCCMLWEVVIGDDSWDVFECSSSIDELQKLLTTLPMSRL